MNTNFNFIENNVEILDLPTLKRTYKENDIYGNPLKGFYHYDVIDRLAMMCEAKGFDFEIKDIFAAQNRSRQLPGVVVLPQVEEIHGVNSVEAHILRRVFSNIQIHNNQTDEMTTNLAVAYHQDGIQIGLGPLVKVCQNQCILSPERLITNFGAEKVKDEDIFKIVENWLDNFFDYQVDDMQVIEKMRKIWVSEKDVYQLIGLLTSIRVAKDSANKDLQSSVKKYPLTQSQISQFTEDYLINKNSVLSLWDVYNVSTKLYKADKMDIPNVLPQNLAMIEVLKSNFSF